MKVKWYQSLRFKLFLMMSLYLLVTVLGISWQNGRVFREMLDRQNQDNLIGVAKKGGYSVSGMLELWSSLAHSLMHNVANSDRATFESSVKGFLSSNKETVSFQLISVGDDGEISPVLYRFTEYGATQRFEGQSAKVISPKIEQMGLHAVEKLRKAKKIEKFVDNVFTETKLPMLQMGFPFQIKAQKITYWAVLTVWQERITAHLEHTNSTRSYVLKSGGKVFLAHSKDFEGLKNLDPGISAALANQSEFGFKSFNDIAGKPVMASYSLIPNSDLTFIVERSASAEYDYLNWRIRKIAIFAWIFLLITVMGSYVAAGRITKGIDAVAYTTLQIAQGDLSARNPARSNDEVGLLAASVNHMASEIHRLLVVQVEVARQEKELRTAQAVQGTLFPKVPPSTAAINITGHYEPASECAGDWWGHFKLTEHKSVFVIADATGHGAPAALLVAIVFAYFQTLMATSEMSESNIPNPARMLDHLNRIFWQSGEGTSTMTMFVGLIDMMEGQISFVNAGHVNPLIIPAHADDSRLTAKRAGGAGKAKRILPVIGHGSPLGYKADPVYDEFTLKIAPGDKFFFYTDGLLECTNYANAQYGSPVLKKRLSALCDLSAEELKERILREAREHFGDHPRADDITVVVAEVSRQWNPATGGIDSLPEIDSPLDLPMELPMAGNDA